jgi:hypothetical protein
MLNLYYPHIARGEEITMMITSEGYHTLKSVM